MKIYWLLFLYFASVGLFASESSSNAFTPLSPLLDENSYAHFKVQKIAGKAKNAYGKSLYTEKHADYFKNDRLIFRKSQFFSNEGALIAEIGSDFSKSLILPNYHLINYLARSEEVLIVTDLITMKYRAPGEATYRVATLAEEPNLVSGFGVEQFFRMHLADLASAKIVQLNLAVVPKLASFPFRGELKKVKGFETHEFLGVLFEFDFGMLGSLFPWAEFVFNKPSQQMVFFHGPSNILNEHGNRPIVYTRFEPEVK